MTLYEEIFSQAAVIEHSLANNLQRIEEIAAAINERRPQHIFIAARGTSDNAARYAQYVWGVYNQLPVGLATPSLFSLYRQPPQLDGALVVGISQSGQSPDIVEVVAEGRRQGRPTLAITNNAASPLAEAAEYVIDIGAGEEHAVAATKTYSAQLLAIAMLSTALAEDAARLAQLAAVPEWITAVLAQDAAIARIAPRYRYMNHCAVLGRGYNYATAFEWSLKMKELAYVIAEPYSSADFRHGPIAVIGDGFPVMAVAPNGAVYDDMEALLVECSSKGAELLIISDNETLLARATSPVELPAGIPEWLSPLVTIVPAQLFSYHLTAVKGLDTERPRGLRKVTRTL